MEAFTEAVARYGAPEIVNTDQGSQFSSAEFVSAVKACGAKQSMDGRGCWRDNVFVERLWRSVKYEEVYIKAYDCVGSARAGLARYFELYNAQRPAPGPRWAHARHGVLRDPDDVAGRGLSMKPGLLTASVVRSSQATPAQRSGQP